MNIFNKLDQLKDLTPNEQILIQYIKEQPEKFVTQNASQICKSCFVSSSTLYRFIRKLGLSGLSEFKIKISASIDYYLNNDEELDYDYPIEANVTQYQITHKMKQLYEQTIHSSMELIDLEQLRIVSFLLKKTPYIDFYTSAGNIYFAQNFKFQMQEIGRFVNVPIEEYHQRLTASSGDNKHVALVMSFSGRGKIMNDLMHILKSNKTPIVLITSTKDNPLVPLADYCLYLSSNENHYNKISSFATRLSLLYLLDCLYTCYFKLDYDENIKKKLESYAKLSGKYE